MPRATVVNHVSLDGVMQAPGRPDEYVATRTLSEASLFAPDGAPVSLRLTRSVITTTGVVIATYASGDG